MKRLGFVSFVAGAIALTGCATSTPNVAAAPVATTASTPAVELPCDTNVLFWTQPQRDLAFRVFDQIAPSNRVAAGGDVRRLPQGQRLAIDPSLVGGLSSIDAYMDQQRLAGLIVIQNGVVRLERYGLGFGAEGRWTSFSVAKSFTSTLVGAAVHDGYISSLSDPVTRYIPALVGSGYDGVTITQLLSMQSGVRWNESYTDPNSDVARFNNQAGEDGLDPVTTYMRRLPRVAEPGTRWNYNTGETNLIGVLVERATGKTLSAYLSEKVWRPYGMETDAGWLLNSGGEEIAGCCLSITLRDYGRFGMFVLGGGQAGGQQVVPEGWFASAGRKQADIGWPGFGYGYQWWTYDDGSFAAQGIFGQGIFIDPARNLVIAGLGSWPTATDGALGAQRLAFYQAVRAAIDAELPRAN